MIIKNNRHIKLFEKEKLDEDVSLTLDLVYPDDIKMLYCLKISKYEDYKKFRIGRSQNCDIKLNQETISRLHAKINYEDDEFYIKDLDSTYGTMVLLKEPLKFSNSKRNETCLVNGSTLIEIKFGGAKEVEKVYLKDGEEKRCVVYSDFKNKIPINMRNFIDKNLKNVTVKTPENKVQSNNKLLKNHDEEFETSSKNHSPPSSKNIELLIEGDDKQQFSNSGNGKIKFQDAGSNKEHVIDLNQNVSHKKHKHCLRDNFLPSMEENILKSEFHTKVAPFGNNNRPAEKEKDTS